MFVALAMMVSSFVPANTLTKADQFTGESGRAEKTLESSFPKPATELVLIHSGTLTADDPAFKRGDQADDGRLRRASRWSSICGLRATGSSTGPGVEGPAHPP